MRGTLSISRLTTAIVAGFGVATIGLSVTKTAAAADVPPSLTMPANTPISRAAANYWTSERYKNAKPLVLTSAGKPAPAAAAAAAAPSAPVPGGAPTVPYDPAAAVQLYTPDAASPSGGAKTTLVGTGNYPFTVNELYPVADTWMAYPYAVVGKLFFTIPGSGDFVCSASVIRKRVIATAGHCVSDGRGHFYQNWSFVPALNSGAAPLGAWTWSRVVTTNNWFNGGGSVPNIQDDALLVLNDKSFSGVLRKIGDLVGFLGFEYNAARPTAITQLGYPCNLDSCARPIADYAQLFGGPTNNFEWGTVEFGGASGGPEVQDFGQKPNGTPTEIFGGNLLLSVTSYTYNDAAVRVDGGSILGAPNQFAGNTFGDLLNFFCIGASNVGNCW